MLSKVSYIYFTLKDDLVDELKYYHAMDDITDVKDRVLIRSLPWRDFLLQAVRGRESNVRNLGFLILLLAMLLYVTHNTFVRYYPGQASTGADQGDSKKEELQW